MRASVMLNRGGRLEALIISVQNLWFKLGRELALRIRRY